MEGKQLLPRKHHYQSDEVRTIEDEKKRTIDLEDFNLELPTVDIFDEPTRCYAVNHEWAKIITGAIDILCEIAVWKDATDEGYVGIRKIQEFLKGSNCMSCNDVEICLSASPIIADILAQIANNDTDITNLQNVDTTHAADIIALYAENDVQDLEIGDHALSIQQINLTIAYHAELIAALQNASSGNAAGKVKFKTTSYHNLVTYNSSYSGIAYATMPQSVQMHQFSYKNAHIIATSLNKYELQNPNFATILIQVDGQNGTNEWKLQGIAQRNVHLGQFMVGMDITAPIEMNLQWKVDVAGKKVKEINGTNITWTILEYEIENPLVTFDSGTYPYTLPLAQEGKVLSGGNPNDCLKGISLVLGEYISVLIDLGGDVEIHDVIYDARSSELNGNSTKIYVDGSLIGGNSYIGATPNTWETFKQSDWSALLPVTGRIVEVRFVAATSVFDMRIDNIKVVI